MVRLTLVTLTAAAVLAAGCGDDGGDDNAAAPSEDAAMKAKEDAAMKTKEDAAMKKKEEAAMKAKGGATVKVVSSQFGRILADKKGQAFYLFDKEKTEKSECYGECAEAWPPVLTKGEPQADGAAKGDLIGTTKRRDGQLQVTYRGRPLYYFVKDSPGNVLCHNVDEFGGKWLVVQPSGSPVS